MQSFKSQTGKPFYEDLGAICKSIRGASANCAGLNAHSAIDSAQVAIKILETYISNPKQIVPY